MTDAEQLRSIIRHIKRVEDNCNLLARKIKDEGFEFTIALIQRGRVHDASKFDHFEFQYLRDGSAWFKEALGVHRSKNSHHPEFHRRGIQGMSNLDIAEMVCDCLARGQEFGTDTRQWFRDEATVKYRFSMDDEIGNLITKYLDLLLPLPFKTVK